jgi:hypothetical protein
MVSSEIAAQEKGILKWIMGLLVGNSYVVRSAANKIAAKRVVATRTITIRVVAIGTSTTLFSSAYPEK